MANIFSAREAKLLRLLPFYIEHKLLQQLLRYAKQWQMERTNPTWQAICRYYSLCVKFEPVGASDQDVRIFREWLAAGLVAMVSMESAEYPTHWEIDFMCFLRNPRTVVLNFGLDALGWSEKSKPPEAELPLTGFTSHMKTKSRGVLTVSLISRKDKCPLMIFDDGLFKSADEIDLDYVKSNPACKKILVNHPWLNADDVRREIWRRWESGWAYAKPPKIVTEDKQRFSGTDYIAAIMSEYLKHFDQVEPMLKAVLKWKRDQAPVVKAIGEFIQREFDADPNGTTSRLNKLTKESRDLLMSHFPMAALI